jgi:hypothetical protein
MSKGMVLHGKLIFGFQPPLLKKRMDPWKVTLFGHAFSRERDDKPYPKFYMTKVVPRI